MAAGTPSSSETRGHSAYRHIQFSHHGQNCYFFSVRSVTEPEETAHSSIFQLRRTPFGDCHRPVQFSLFLSYILTIMDQFSQFSCTFSNIAFLWHSRTQFGDNKTVLLMDYRPASCCEARSPPVPSPPREMRPKSIINQPASQSPGG